MNWTESQIRSDEILASGIANLKKGAKSDFGLNGCSSKYGNYLIESGKLRYIGEATNVAKRLKQHSKSSSSTFYKNYLKSKSANQMLPQNLSIDDFNVRTMDTDLGRKEIEEFGIVNLPANLNRFQKGKRQRYTKTESATLWHDIQQEADRLLDEGAKIIMRKKFDPWKDANPIVGAGIYLIRHPKDGMVYIGESSNASERFGSHNDRAYFSALRRNVARDILGYSLTVKNGKKRYLSESKERGVSNYLSSCGYVSMKIELGRCELEEHLIRLEEPILNRKVNKRN